jgi:hypothetical protein
MSRVFIKRRIFRILPDISVCAWMLRCTLTAASYTIASCQLCIAACDQVYIARGTDAAPHFDLGGGHFNPVGVNYFHFNRSGPYQTFDTFDPAQFDPAEMDAALGAISQNGFNYVRLLLTGYYPDRGFDGAPSRIGEPYIRNLLTTLGIAETHGLHVVLSGLFQKGTSIPRNYLPANMETHALDVEGPNRLLLVPSYVEGLATFYRDLLKELNQRRPGILSCVFYTDLYNEIKYDAKASPFSQHVGTYAFQNRAFRLDLAVEREELANTAATYWFRTMKSAVVSVAPDMLVTASTFPNSAFGRRYFNGVQSVRSSVMPTRDPYPVSPQVLEAAGADLLDIHLYVYPAGRAPAAMHDDLFRVLGSDGIGTETWRSIPVIIGELGAMKTAYPSPDAAANEIRATIKAFCNFHVAGWAFWMWDGQGSTWSLTEQNNALARVLSPADSQATPVACDALGTKR